MGFGPLTNGRIDGDEDMGVIILLFVFLYSDSFGAVGFCVCLYVCGRGVGWEWGYALLFYRVYRETIVVGGVLFVFLYSDSFFFFGGVVILLFYGEKIFFS